VGGFGTRVASAESPIAEPFIAWEPQFHRRNQVLRGSVLCHGHGATSTAYYTSSSTTTRDIGYVGIAPDCGGATNWGNDASQTALTNAFTYLTTGILGCKTDKIVLNCGSMGALAGLRWAKDNPTKVAAILLSIPATSLVDLHDNNRGGYAAEMETAHGVSGTYAGNATIIGKDPAQNTSAIAAIGCPIRLYYSTDDPICVPSATTTFGAAVGAEMISMGAQGHATGSPYSTDEADLFQARYAA
jgi:hypothetical protein